MKKKIVVLTGLFILFIIMQAPASLIDQFLPEKAPVSVSGLNGSLWSGEVAMISAAGFDLSDVEFSVNPLALLTGKLSLDLDISDKKVYGDLNIKVGSDYQQNIELNDVNLILPASALDKFIPMKGISLSGEISSSELEVKLENKKPVNMRGLISWNRMAVTFGGNTWNIGNFAIDTSTDETKKIIVGTLQKTKNELGLEGKLTLFPDGMLEFIGSISTDIDQSLYNKVALFNNGKPAGGRLPIKFKQKVLR